MEDYFAPFGKVQYVRLIRKARSCRVQHPVAIVEFAQQQDAQNALNQCHHGSNFTTRDKEVVLSVTWAFVQPSYLSMNHQFGENRM